MDRLRQLISGALTIAELDFAGEPASFEALPPWFLERDEIAFIADRRYSEARAEEPWTIREWISCFAPGLRRWSWWDVTVRANGTVAVWVDIVGDEHIPCEELWWALYICGAGTVESLRLELPETWQAETLGT
ncbi:hypothetical protein ACWDOP_19500 [Nocardia sp. NPDC003693]